VEAVCLEPRDAEFVHIIHADGSAFLKSLGMGYRSSIGHVDFYPNGGAEQPGCEKTVLSRLTSSAASGLTSGTEGIQLAATLRKLFYIVYSFCCQSSPALITLLPICCGWLIDFYSFY